MYNTKILEFVTRFLCPADLLYLQFTAGLHRNPMHIDLFKKRLYQSIKFVFLNTHKHLIINR